MSAHCNNSLTVSLQGPRVDSFQNADEVQLKKGKTAVLIAVKLFFSVWWWCWCWICECEVEFMRTRNVIQRNETIPCILYEGRFMVLCVFFYELSIKLARCNYVSVLVFCPRFDRFHLFLVEHKKKNSNNNMMMGWKRRGGEDGITNEEN